MASADSSTIPQPISGGLGDLAQHSDDVAGGENYLTSDFIFV